METEDNDAKESVSNSSMSNSLTEQKSSQTSKDVIPSNESRKAKMGDMAKKSAFM